MGGNLMKKTGMVIIVIIGSIGVLTSVFANQSEPDCSQLQVGNKSFFRKSHFPVPQEQNYYCHGVKKAKESYNFCLLAKQEAKSQYKATIEEKATHSTQNSIHGLSTTLGQTLQSGLALTIAYYNKCLQALDNCQKAAKWAYDSHQSVLNSIKNGSENLIKAHEDLRKLSRNEIGGYCKEVINPELQNARKEVEVTSSSLSQTRQIQELTQSNTGQSGIHNQGVSDHTAHQLTQPATTDIHHSGAKMQVIRSGVNTAQSYLRKAIEMTDTPRYKNMVRAQQYRKIFLKILHQMPRTNYRVSPTASEQGHCTNSNYGAYVLKFGGDVYFCNRIFSGDHRDKLPDTLIHETAHVIGFRDECDATRIANAALSFSGQRSNNSYVDRCL